MGASDTNNLTGIHAGEDIYILGSGATMDFYDPKFFDGRVTIGLNLIYKFIPVTYVHTHHHEIVQEAINEGANVITSKHHICHPAHDEHNFTGDYYFYHHKHQLFCDADVNGLDENPLIIAGTPVVGAMHIAYKMGARAIFLCGVDGGTIDGKMNYSKYPVPTQAGHPTRVDGVIKKLADQIRASGVPVCYLLPFTTLRLDGHEYSSIC